MLRSLFLALAMCTVAACSGVETIPEDTARFEATGFSTFAWRSEPVSQNGFSRDRLAQADPFIRDAVQSRLLELGYRLAPREEADFLVEYLAAAGINDGQLARTASNVTPYPSATIGRIADGATVDNAYALGGVKEMGNLLLVFVDPRASEVLWRVTISKVIEDANQISENAVHRAVRQGLSTLPAAP
jgi:hypothetical protein